jgi:hypothetical protein
VSTSDGAVIGTTQIFGSAPRNRAFNVVLLAEGFTTTQQNDFNNAYRSLTRPNHAPPSSHPALTFSVNVSSTDSGADDPAGMAVRVRVSAPTLMPPLAPITSVGYWFAIPAPRFR